MPRSAARSNAVNAASASAHTPSPRAWHTPRLKLRSHGRACAGRASAGRRDRAGPHDAGVGAAGTACHRAGTALGRRTALERCARH
jgi:hypothetical protein